MALRQIMLRTKIDKKKAELEALRGKDKDFAAREAELETAIGEAQTDEEQTVIGEQVEQFESEKAAHEAAKRALETDITGLEAELEAAEKMPPQEPEKRAMKVKGAQRVRMSRKKFFGMDAQERDAFFADEEVKAFLQRTRDIASEKRAVKGTDLTIPTVVLDLIRENIMDYSKLVNRVRLRTVSGKARQNVMGTIPEAVWTEMCAKLNEIDFGFTQTEVDGYKVGGVIYICVATLEDSDYNLASEIINALGIAIGIALDKAILYGVGTKMPLGIATRLGQTSEPRTTRQRPGHGQTCIQAMWSRSAVISTGLISTKKSSLPGGRLKTNMPAGQNSG